MHFSPSCPGALSAGGAPSLGAVSGDTFPFLACICYYMPGRREMSSRLRILTGRGEKPFRAKFPLCAAVFVCYNGCSSKGWRLIPMASKTSAREERKKKIVRVVAIVACAALLLTALLPYIASALY